MLEIRIHPSTLTSEERLLVLGILGAAPLAPALSGPSEVKAVDDLQSRIAGAVVAEEPAAPFVPAVPSTAVAAPSPTAPAAPLVTTPAPTSATPQSATPVTGIAAPAPGVELDVKGMPWDGRIHASTRAKLQDGTWRQKRNTDPAYITQVENELRAAMGAPAPAAAAPAAPTVAAAVPSAPPVTGAPAAPAAPAGGTTAASPSSFAEFLQKVTAAVTAGSFAQADVIAACQAVGVPTLPALGARPDLIPSVCLQLGI